MIPRRLFLPLIAGGGLLLSGCGKTSVITKPEPVPVEVRVMVKVDPSLTVEEPVFERSDQRVKSYVQQADENTSALRKANAKLRAIKEAQPDE